MSLEWKLRQVMAKNDIWSGTELVRQMEDKAGYTLSAASISALLNGSPKMIRSDTLDALCTALDCTPSDLLVHKPTRIGSVNQTRNIELQKESNSKKVSNGRPLPPI